MPRVRLYPEQREALARQRAAEAASEDDVERDIDLARARDLELAAKVQQIRTDAVARRGIDAEQAATEAQDAVRSAWNEIAANVTSSRMHDMLRDNFDRRVEVLGHELDAHVGRERNATRRNNALRLKAIAQQDAMESATTYSLKTNLKTVEDAIDEQARIDNLEPTEVVARKQEALRAIVAGRTIHLIDTDQFDEAAAWYRTSETLLANADRADIEAHLQQASLRAPGADAIERPDRSWLVVGKGGEGLDLGEASSAGYSYIVDTIADQAVPLASMNASSAIQAQGQTRPSSGAARNSKASEGKTEALIPLKRGGKGSIAFGFVARATDPASAQWLNDHVKRYGFGPTKLKPIVDNFYNNDPSDKHAMSRNAAYIAIAMGQRDRKKFDNTLLFGRALAMRVGIDADMQKDPPKKFDRTTSAALVSARASVDSTIKAKATSPAARNILSNWLTGRGPSYLYFGPDARETRELLDSDKGYYRDLFDFVINWLANGKYKTGDLRDGYWATSVVHKDFGAIAGLNGLRDGAQMEDIIGTPKYGIDLHVKGGRIYYTMANDMDLSSFAGGNLLGTQVYLPKEGQPFSRVHMIFQWSETIPAHLLPKK